MRHFLRPKPLEGKLCTYDLTTAKALMQRSVRIRRQKCQLNADPTHVRRDPLNVIDGQLHRVRAARRRRFHAWRPESSQLVFERLKPVSEIAGGLRLAALIDEYRQIPANPNGIHVVEEEEPVAAQQILDVVL